MIIKPVYAHCDIPCGIYETDTMKHSAATCKRMIEKIESLENVASDEVVDWGDYLQAEYLEKAINSLPDG